MDNSVFKDKEKLLVKYISLGNYYNLELKDFPKAIEYYEKYIELDKTKSVVYTILANLYDKAYGDDSSSLERQFWCYECANSLKPNDRLILHGLAFCSEKLGKNNTADKYYQQLLRNNPTAIDYFNYGCFLIHTGNFIQGHKYFVYRNFINNGVFKNTLTPDLESIDKFLQNLSDKTILVHYEQGFGDTIMYSRFVPLLKDKAKKIIFVVQPELYNLIKNSKCFEGIEIISDKDSLKDIEYDLPVMLLDTPLILKTDSNNLPYAEGYLDTQKTQNNLSNNLYKIGIAYCGDKNANYKNRDINIEFFKSLMNIKGIQLYSLQKDCEEIEGIIPLGEDFKDFTDSANAIKDMDLIISSDNVILNLSGALGVKTFGLFNKQTNYRWFKLNDNTGWYKSIKPIQAKSQNNWDSVFEELKKQLEDLLL